jgi:PKD repeat protein
VNWGDGSAASVGQRTATGTIPATYAYQKNGTYTVTVSVSDKDGGVGRASYTVAVGQTKTRR